MKGIKLMRITESKLRRIIRSVILEQLQLDGISPEAFNRSCQNYYENPYSPDDYVDSYDYYNKLERIFEIGGNMEDGLFDVVERLGLKRELSSKEILGFVEQLFSLTNESFDDNVNKLLGYIIDTHS